MVLLKWLIDFYRNHAESVKRYLSLVLLRHALQVLSLMYVMQRMRAPFGLRVNERANMMIK